MTVAAADWNHLAWMFTSGQQQPDCRALRQRFQVAHALLCFIHVKHSLSAFRVQKWPCMCILAFFCLRRVYWRAL
jgi:hypothetical protein